MIIVVSSLVISKVSRACPAIIPDTGPGVVLERLAPFDARDIAYLRPCLETVSDSRSRRGPW